jgi:hypothetical protein
MKLVMENWKKYTNKEIKESYFDEAELELKQMISKRSASSYVKQILQDDADIFLKSPKTLNRLLDDIYRHDEQKYREVLFLLLSEIGKMPNTAHKLITDKRFLEILTRESSS